MNRGYRADLDGIRAIAVLAVIGFHSFPGWVPNGFIGVDIFFAISGYLITSNIYSQVNRGNFKLSIYFKNRINRIYPALLIILFFSLIYGAFNLNAKEYEHLGIEAASSTVFLLNIVLQNELNYFNFDSQFLPLLNLWSLSVEAHFYLILPIIILIVYRQDSIKIGILLIATLTLFSFSFNIYLSKMGSSGYLLTLTRIWEVLLGSMIIFFNNHDSNPINNISQIKRNIYSALGIFLILYPIFLNAAPSDIYNLQLMTVSGTCLLIFGGNKSFINNLLSFPPIVFIGKISYPLYLWHWPIIAFGWLEDGKIPSRNYRVASIFIALVLACTTYFLIEKPFSRYKGKNKHLILLLISIIILIFSLLIYSNNGYPARIKSLTPEMKEVLAIKYDYSKHYREGRCFLEPEQIYTEYNNCESTGQANGKKIFIWGDSYAAHLYPGIAENYKENLIIQRTSSLCPPILEVDYPSRPNCFANNKYIIKEIGEINPEVIILSASWANYSLENLGATLDTLKKMGINRIVLFGPVPEWKSSLPKQLERNIQKNKLSQIPLRMNYGLEKYGDSINDKLIHIAKLSNVEYFSPINSLCNSDGCLIITDEKNRHLTAWDSGHLTNQGSSLLIRNYKYGNAL